VFGFVFMTTFLFSLIFSYKLTTHLWYGALIIRMILIMCLSSFSICMFVILIAAYVYLNMYRHFTPLPHSYTFVAIFICIVCVMLILVTMFLLEFFFFRNLIDACVTVSVAVIILLLIS